MSQRVRVERIMEEIKKELSAKGLDNDFLPFESIQCSGNTTKGSLRKNLRYVKISFLNFLYLKVYKNTPDLLQTFLRKHFKKADHGFVLRKKK